jgi:hypothetical protein
MQSSNQDIVLYKSPKETNFHKTELGEDKKSIVYRADEETIKISTKSQRSARLLLELINAGEKDFELLRTGSHYYLFGHQQTIQISEFSLEALDKLKKIVRYHEQQCNSKIQRHGFVRDSNSSQTRSGNQRNKDSREFSVSLESDLQVVPDFEWGDLSLLFGRSTGGRNNDGETEGTKFLRQLCEGVCSENEIIERLISLDSNLTEKEQRGGENISRGFRVIKEESGSLSLIGVGQVLAGIGEKGEVGITRNYVSAALIARRIYQLYQEFEQHNARIKEFYNSRHQTNSGQ